MRKLSRTQLRAWVRSQLSKQGGVCLLCHKPIDLSIPREGVADYDHNTGQLRGVLHRSCNAAEGKVLHAASRWGSKSADPAAVLAFLENLVEYYKMPNLDLLYPTHQTAEEKRLADNAKRRKQRAVKRATRQVRSMPRKEMPPSE